MLCRKHNKLHCKVCAQNYSDDVARKQDDSLEDAFGGVMAAVVLTEILSDTSTDSFDSGSSSDFSGGGGGDFGGGGSDGSF